MRELASFFPSPSTLDLAVVAEASLHHAIIQYNSCIDGIQLTADIESGDRMITTMRAMAPKATREHSVS